MTENNNGEFVDLESGGTVTEDTSNGARCCCCLSTELALRLGAICLKVKITEILSSSYDIIHLFMYVNLYLLDILEN